MSLAAQESKIIAWADVNGYDITAIHVDAGLSGKRADNRPALQDALDHACHENAVLVVYSLSRLARSTKDTLAIAERLDKAGADLASISERIDTTTAAGKMVFRLLAVLAEFERDLVSERTISALAHKRQKGERVGMVPFGYDLCGDGISLSENPFEQAVIKTIIHLRSRGLSFRAIAEELAQQGVATKRGNKTWSHTSVRRILMRIVSELGSTS